MLQVDFLYVGKSTKNDFSTNSNILMTLSKSLCLYTAILRKVSEKVMQQSQNVNGFEFAVLQRNLKEWHKRHGLTCMFADGKGKQQK